MVTKEWVRNDNEEMTDQKNDKNPIPLIYCYENIMNNRKIFLDFKWPINHFEVIEIMFLLK